MATVKFVIAIVMVVAIGVLAEPPSPRQYLPPGQGHQNGGGRHGGGGQHGGGGYQQQPSNQYGAPAGNGGGNGGFGGYPGSRGSGQDDDLAEPANYEFTYEVQDDESGANFGHQESREGDEARGSYHVLLPDGRTQIVDYVANNEGYMPTIRYEEAQGGYPAAGGRGQGQGGYNY